MSTSQQRREAVIEAAVDAYRRGLTPIPIPRHSKAPNITGWTDIR